MMMVMIPRHSLAASFLLEGCNVLLTENKDHFERLPNLKSKVMTPEEFN